VALAAPRLEIDRTFVDLGVSLNRRNVSASTRLFNRGLGVLRGTIVSDRLWLVTVPTSFECETGRSIELGISTDMDEFPDDLTEDRGIISITSNGGTIEIDTLLRLERQPELREPEPVRFRRANGEESLQGRLVLHNEGLATAHVSIQPSDERLAVSRERVEVKPGKSVRVSVSWQGAVPAEAPTAYLRVIWDTDERVVPVILE